MYEQPIDDKCNIKLYTKVALPLLVYAINQKSDVAKNTLAKFVTKIQESLVELIDDPSSSIGNKKIHMALIKYILNPKYKLDEILEEKDIAVFNKALTALKEHAPAQSRGMTP